MKAKRNQPANNNQPSAKVLEGKLILSIPHAIDPVVWQMDLSEVDASALKVEQKGKTDHYRLLMSASNDVSNEIAVFETKDAGIQTLMEISAALENAHGHMHARSETNYASGNYSNPPYLRPQNRENKKTGRKTGTIILGLVLLFVLFTFWASMQPAPPSMVQQSASTTSQNQQASQNPADQSGVPVSADAFLQGR